MLAFPFVVVGVRVIPSDFERASSEGNRDHPASEENGKYQGQRSRVHKPSPMQEGSATANHLAVTQITGDCEGTSNFLRSMLFPRRRRRRLVEESLPDK